VQTRTPPSAPLQLGDALLERAVLVVEGGPGLRVQQLPDLSRRGVDGPLLRLRLRLQSRVL
jgi:hypothetical protein